MLKIILNIGLILLLNAGVYTSVVVLNGAQISHAQTQQAPVPTNFTIDLFGEDDVILLWDKVNEGAIENIIVERGLANQPLTEIVRLSIDETSYVDETPEIGSTYNYRVVTVGPGLINGATDAKSVTIVKQTIFEEIQQTNNNPVANAVAAVSGDEQIRNFWLNLAAFNLLAIGVGMIIYLIVKSKPETAQIPVSSRENIRNLRINVKSNNTEPKIDAEAEKRYERKLDKKLNNWKK